MGSVSPTLLTPVECRLPHIMLSAVETVSESKGLPLALFFHGITANAYVFQPVLDQLAAEFRCVSVDIPNYPATLAQKNWVKAAWSLANLQAAVPEAAQDAP